MPIVAQSRELARRINREAREDPDSPYAGKYVGIANGRVVATVDALRELMDELGNMPFRRDELLCIEADADYEGPHHVWGTA